VQDQLRRAVPRGALGGARQLQPHPDPEAHGSQRDPDRFGKARGLGARRLLGCEEGQRRIDRADLSQQAPRSGGVEEMRPGVARRPRAGRQPARMRRRPPAERREDEPGVERERRPGAPASGS
jgi:hypothetical protein